MDYPNDKEVLETCECQEPVNFTCVDLPDAFERQPYTSSFSYKFAHIVKALRALINSTKTSVRINSNGLLSLQFLMPPSKPGGSEAFMEYRVSFVTQSKELT